MVKAQTTRRQKNIFRLIYEKRALTNAKIKSSQRRTPKGKSQIEIKLKIFTAFFNLLHIMYNYFRNNRTELTINASSDPT